MIDPYDTQLEIYLDAIAAKLAALAADLDTALVLVGDDPSLVGLAVLLRRARKRIG